MDRARSAQSTLPPQTGKITQDNNALKANTADDTYFGPFSSRQWASVVVAVAGFILLLRRFHRPLQELAAPQKSLPLISSQGKSV